MIAADFRVCLDACVLANHAVCDLLLKLAEKPRMYLPIFSEDILDEVRRVHVDKLNWPVDLADYFQAQIRDAFKEAIVEDYQQLIPILTNHEGDRHVLAAAIKGEAQLIVTFNLKDFRSTDLAPWEVEAQHPQDYLITLFEFRPENVIAKLFEIAQKQNQTAQARLAKLARSLPRFAEVVAEAMDWDLSQTESPSPPSGAGD